LGSQRQSYLLPRVLSSLLLDGGRMNSIQRLRQLAQAPSPSVATSRISPISTAYSSKSKQTGGRIDILFANAGLGEFAPLGAITETHFDRTFDVNVKGTLFTVQKALSLMPRGSSIVLNASIASVKGLPAFSVYAATKAALRSFARSWIVDLKESQIRVNVVSPGTIPTPAYDSLGLTKEQMADFIDAQNKATPLGISAGTDRPAALFVASLLDGLNAFVIARFGPRDQTHLCGRHRQTACHSAVPSTASTDRRLRPHLGR
jgi:NAD(P)-dependent dehydrogenase (short-subunit alcohol dehydrogenase family)